MYGRVTGRRVRRLAAGRWVSERSRGSSSGASLSGVFLAKSRCDTSSFCQCGVVHWWHWWHWWVNCHGCFLPFRLCILASSLGGAVPVAHGTFSVDAQAFRCALCTGQAVLHSRTSELPWLNVSLLQTTFLIAHGHRICAYGDTSSDRQPPTIAPLPAC